MDIIEISMKGEVDCKKPRLMVHTSELTNHHINGHSGSINLSYQIVLQDHNYGAPFPPPNSESISYSLQCKQEPNEVVLGLNKSGLKTLTPRPSNHVSPQSPAGRGQSGKANGVGSSLLAKRQRTSSGSNPNGVTPNACTSSSASTRRPGPNSGVETPKSSHGLVSPPLVPKVALSAFPYAGDLNSRLYASASTAEKNVVGIKEEFGRGTLPTTNGSSGLSSYLSGNWCHGTDGKSVGGRLSMRDIFKDDDSNCSLDSPRMGTESDREGEETETAPECEDEEDDRPEPHSNLDESVTRCICKFGHDDGYMICCDRCSVWQHVDCMNLDRNNIPDEFMCELCQPRRVDRARARAVQYKKRQEFRLSTPPPSGSGRSTVASRRDKSKDGFNHSRFNKQEDYIDVEKTPKKFQRNNSISTPASGTGKVARGGAKNSGGLVRGDGPKSNSKRGIPPQPKFKRKSDKHDDVAPRKRKIFRSKGSDTVDVDAPSSTNPSENSPGMRNSHPNGELLLQWIDHYEEAVTNHYSPELRARVSSVRPNGLQQGGDLPSLTSFTPAYRLASKAGGYKTLVASTPILCGSPVIECRGKYMLASQLRPYKTNDGPGGGAGLGLSGLRPTPHIIFHFLQTASVDNTSPSPSVEMCVDGRSYGNEARFVWQSCQPNAEVKHKVEKGSVHLYLIAKTEILDSEEITVAHDTKNPLPCPYEGCPHMKNKDSGTRTGLAPLAVSATTPTSGAATASTASASPVEGERYKRRRRRTNSTLTSPTVEPQPTTPITHAVVSPRVELPPVPSSAPANAVAAPPTSPAQSAPHPPTSVKRGQRTPSKTSAIATEGEDSQDGIGHNPTPDESENPNSMDAKTLSSNKKKLSREERKMEAIMKAFERMEKAQQRRQESISKTSHRKDSRDSREDKDEAGGLADHEADQSPPTYSSGLSQLGEKRVVMIGQETRTKSFKRGKRGGRIRRASSGAGISENSRIRMRALSGEVHSGHSATEEESEQGGSSSSPSQGGSHRGSQADDASLLMTAFKCPKTKKVVFNDWSGDGSEINSARGDPCEALGGSNSLPLSLSVPVCYMRNPNPRSPTRPFRTAHLRPSTLASLKSPAGSSSPDPHGDGGAQSNDENSWTAPLSGSGGPGGSAKKRWLRQAISEETESESPTAGGFCSSIISGGSGTPLGNSGDALDHVTPLKKRRLARASMSSETSFTPPSTPTPTNAILGGPGESCGLSSESSGNISAVLEEVPSVESLSGDNSQDTPPECNDPPSSNVEVDARYLTATSASSSAQALSEDQTNSLCDVPISDTLQPSWTRSEESIPSDAELSLGPGEPTAANVTSQFHSFGEDVFSPSVSRPTWEFRAPDIQFMRQLSRNASEAMSTDSAVDSSLTETSMEGQIIESSPPKPIKRKLSILEYRKRKQVLFTDGSDIPKVDLSPETTSTTTARTTDPSSVSTETIEPMLQKEESTAAEIDHLNLVNAEPFVQDSMDQQHLPPSDGLTADISEAMASCDGKITSQ